MNLFRRYLAAAIVLIIFFQCAAVSIYAQDLAANLPIDPNVIKGTLANGLTYYVRRNGHPENRVELRLVVKAGSILEDDDQQGLAHFLEHMNFNGTVNFKKNELVSYLQTIGMQFGADVNASTSFDHTVYKLSLPLDNLGNLEKGFQVLEDWAHNALLTDSEIDAERGVVLEESRLHKGAGQRAYEQYIPELYSGSRYAQRLPIGKDSILRSFKYDALRRFYRDWYRPDLMAVVVVGDIDTAVALNMVRKHFAPLTNPPNERPHFYADVKSRSEANAIVIKDKEATAGHLMIVYPYEKEHETATIGDYLFNIKRSLIVSMLNERFTDLLHNGQNPANSKFVSFNTTPHGYEAFAASCNFSNEYGPGQGVRLLMRELARVRNHLFNQSELDFTRKKWMSEAERDYAERSNETSTGYASEYVRNFADNTDISGLANHYNLVRQYLPSIELKELDTMVRNLVKNPYFLVVAVAPDKPATWPSANAVLLKMTQDGFCQYTEPLKEKDIDTVLMEDKPRTGIVTSRTYDAALGTATYTLSNNIKVTIKSTDFKSDEVMLTGIKYGGKNNYDKDDKSNCTYLEPVVQAMGFGDFKSDEIYKAIADKNIKVHTIMNNIIDVVTASSDRKDLEQMMQFLYLRLTRPRKDIKAFNTLVKRQGKSIDDMYADPQTYFRDTLSKIFYNKHPLAENLPRPSDLEDIDLKRVLKIYKDEFSYADGYHFFIVGNVDTNIAIPLIENYLGGLRESGNVPRIKDKGLRPVSGIHKMTVKKGKDQKSMIMAQYYGTVPFSEQLQLNALLLTDILNIKVTEQLREKMGMIYTGSFSASVKKEPYEHYTIELNLPCGPENVEKLIEAANNEIKAIKENGPTVDDLQKVKSHLLELHKTRLKENQYWMAALENTMFWNRSKDYVLKYESQVNNITQADIQTTANRLFDSKNEFIAVLMPE